MPSCMIRTRDLRHGFVIGRRGDERVVPVLHGIDLEIYQGEIVTLMGRSGSGKSTLLNLLSGYMRPTGGRIWVAGQEVTHLSEGEWATFRLAHYGFVFQSFHLVPSLTAYENVELPLVLRGVGEPERSRRTREMLAEMGLTAYQDHYPSELSGGQQQRVSIARALVLNPPVILADEPTGSLDAETEEEILALLCELNRSLGVTLFIITHDERVAAVGHRCLRLVDGRIRTEVAS